MLDRETKNKSLYAYYALWRETNNIYADYAKKKGIAYNTLLTLYALYDKKSGCTQKELCLESQIAKQSVNNVLKQLEEKAFVSYGLSSDKRNKPIILTESGEKYVNEMIGELNERELEAVERLGLNRINALLETTATFNKYLKEGISTV